MADADDDLEGVAEGVRVRDEEGEEEADGTPGKLFWGLSVIGLRIIGAVGMDSQKLAGRSKGGEDKQQ